MQRSVHSWYHKFHGIANGACYCLVLGVSIASGITGFTLCLLTNWLRHFHVSDVLLALLIMLESN